MVYKTMILLRKIVFYLFLICISSSQLYAIQTHQIMRKIDKESREEAQIEKSETLLEFRKNNLKKKDEDKKPAFHIHEEIVCANEEKSPEGIPEFVSRSRFSEEIVRQDHLKFYLMFEVIKAHLHISQTLYKKGRFIAAENVRYHTDEESFFYPDDVLKDPVFDVYKSIYYIKYVIMPVIEPFMEEVGADIEDTHLRLEFLREPSILPDGKKTHKYIDPDGGKQGLRHYIEHVDVLKQRFDNVRDAYFQMNKIQITEADRLLTAITLYKHAWAAYKNTSICPYYTEVLDPYIETHYIALPDYHDTFVMGYGLWVRGEALMEKYNIITSKRLSPNGRKDKYRQRIMRVQADFHDLYKDIIKDGEHRISYAVMEKKLNYFERTLKKRWGLK